MNTTPGTKFRQALHDERPLQIVGAINALSAKLAAEAGFRALYVSGAGVANASLGLPDLGMTTLTEVLEDVRRIAGATDLPLLVDVDTGFGGGFMVSRTTREMIAAGAAAMHIEDQVQSKRCGHRPGKALVSADEMIDRLKAAVDARTDETFVVMARTDAHSVEGLEAAVQRACRYVEAGADMIFSEALSTLDEYRVFTRTVPAPVLANITEFGKTPLFTTSDLASAGVAMALYPLSAFRAMNDAAAKVFTAIRRDGTQQAVIPLMQTRDDLYRILRYHDFEQSLDEHLNKEERNG